jgi:NADH-quinone oxidoreductase subunit C
MRKAVPSASVDLMKERFPEEIEEIAYFAGEVTIRVKGGRLLEILRLLRDDPSTQMNLLSDLSAADYPKDPQRFEINYHLYSIAHRRRVRVKVRVAEGGQVPSVTGIWSTSNWHEREAFDLFGIVFAGHPDLTRILLPDDWKGHPLRKEYPLEGFAEQHPRYR